METRNEHLSLLTDLLPKYRLLNSLYQQIVDNSELSFETQCRITDFYNEFKDKQAFEKGVLNLLLSTDKEKQIPIIVNLKMEINKNIGIYTTHKALFDGINTLNVCTKRYDPLHGKIETKLINTNQLWQELTQIRSSLESASWKNDNITTQQLTKKEETVENSYKKEQEKLQDLYQQQKEFDNRAAQYVENIFIKICELGSSFVFLLDNYFPVEKEKIPVPKPTPVEMETQSESEPQSEIEPDMIFRSKMYDKFLVLEQKLIKNRSLNEDLQWISTHENGKINIKNLIIFLVGLLENSYFLPNKDPKIKTFFENRYHIKIGQNFERKRRESLADEYKAVFYNYLF